MDITQAELIKMLLIVCPLVFFAGFVDSIAGGGGIITMPAYVIAGLPMHYAYGCNKFSSMFTTLTSSVNYIRHGYVKYLAALPAAVMALLGSSVGANTALLLDEKTLRIILLVTLPLVAAFLLFRKGSKEEGEEKYPGTKVILPAGAIGLCCGFYDGFFGPGTGTFLIMAFTGILGLKMIDAGGTAKVANFASNLAALTVLFSNAKVFFPLAIPAAVCGVVGSFIGSKLAMKKGAAIIRPLLIVVFCLLIVKILVDLIQL